MYSVNYKKTVATIFLVRPTIPLDKKELLEPGFPETSKLVSEYGFISAYVADKNHPCTLERPVFMLFKPDMDKFFDLEEFIDKMYRSGKLKEDYDYEGGYVVLLFEFPKSLELDYHRILRGEYSKVSSGFKSYFPYTNSRTGHPNIYAHVFEKSDQLKKTMEEQLNVILTDKDELWVKPDIEDRETLDIERIRQGSIY